jgi:hypothetical protein
MDLSNILNQLSSFTQAAGNSYGSAEANNPWFYTSRKLRTLQSWWEEQLVNEQRTAGMAQDAQLDNYQALLNIDFLDDNFWI